MNKSVVDSFFAQLRAIREKYRPLEENVENTFNIFNVLGLYNRELKHSAFIAELLNPCGTHKMGNRFLRLFYKRIGVEYDGLVSVLTEFPFQDGRIDIYVKAIDDPSKSLIIENKIEAEDQDRQLWRYHQFDPKAKLLYLTLNGKCASAASLFELTHADYLAVGYDSLIVSWLEDCLEIVGDIPVLREIIKQYLNLVKQLTGKTLLQEEKMDIAKLVCENDEYLGLFFHLMNNQNTIYQKLMDRLWDEILAAAEAVGFKASKDRPLQQIYAPITLEMDSEYTVLLAPQKENFQDLIFGIHCKGKKDDIPVEKRNEIREKFAKSIMVPMQEATPIVHNYWTPYKHWSTAQYEKVLNGTFRNDLVELLKKLKALIESV